MSRHHHGQAPPRDTARGAAARNRDGNGFHPARGRGQGSAGPDPDRAPPRDVTGDPARLQQVVWNLLSNAIKFTPRGGRVLVKLTRAKSHVEIRVTDTGKGIKRDFLPHVFERFRQEDASSAREHMGLGIGLALVKHLVELHGGEVRAESGGEGKGSTFTVQIPFASSRLEYREEPTQSATGRPAMFSAELPDLTGVKVLVVDDEPDVRDLLKRILEQSSARTSVAASADEGLEILARECMTSSSAT